MATGQSKFDGKIISVKTGRLIGFEPTTNGTTIHYSNQLSYNRHVKFQSAKLNVFFILAKKLKLFVQNKLVKYDYQNT